MADVRSQDLGEAHTENNEEEMDSNAMTCKYHCFVEGRHNRLCCP